MRSILSVFFLLAMILGAVLGGDEAKHGFRHHTGQPRNFSGRPPFGQWSHGTGSPRHPWFTTTPPAGRK